MPRTNKHQQQQSPVKTGKKSSNGSSSKSRKTRSRKKGGENVKIGTRSGARFHPSKKVATNEDGLESMEGFFKAHDEQSTHTENSSSSRQQEVVHKGVLRTSKSRKRNKLKTPKRVRMSVGGDDDDDNDTVESDKKMPARKRQEDSQNDEASFDTEDAARATQEYAKKLDMTSPSELSKVSTAPPTPAEDQETARFAKDDDDEEEEDEVDKDARNNGFGTQPTEEEEIGVLPQASAETGGDQKPAALEEDRPKSPEPEFPDMGLDDDLAPPTHSDGEDDDNFGLEPPDHSDDDDDEGEPDTRQDGKDPLAKQSSGSSSSSSSSESGEKKPEPAPAAPATSDSGDSDSDSDKEGAGYNMVHDPETPASVRKKRAKEERMALMKKREKDRKKKKRRDDSDTDDESSAMHTPMRKQQTKKKKKKRNVVFSPEGIPIANRSYERKPLDDFEVIEDDDEYNDGRRRSRRRKVKPLEYWRNERLEYGAHNETGQLGQAMGDMPVVVNVIKAGKTPHKKRKAPPRKVETSTAKKKRKQEYEEDVKPYDLKKLKKKYNVVDGEMAFLWDDLKDDPGDMKVIAYSQDLQTTDLPLSQRRPEKDGTVVGQAGQAFNIPNHDSDNYVGYIMGNLRLPPKGVKDPESVGPCSQTFTVCDCQPRALEIAYGDPDLPEGILDPDTAQRFYLSPGDLFRVPPGNCYRLQNRSKTKDALLTWTIIRPRNVANDSDSSD